FFELGPNAGYAYTLVIKKHFFITASAAANLGVGYATYHGEAGRHTQWAVRPNYLLRSFAGYNSSTWSVNVNYVHNNGGLPEYGGFSSAMMTGNYRLNFVYRFLPGPRLQQNLRPVDRLLKM